MISELFREKAESFKFQSLKPILARAVGIDTNAHMHEKIIKPSNSVPCQWCHPSYCTSTKHVYYQNGTNFFLNVIIKFHEKFTKILMWHIKLLYWLTIFFKYCRECFLENKFWLKFIRERFLICVYNYYFNYH